MWVKKLKFLCISYYVKKTKGCIFFRLPIFMGHWLKGEVIMIYEILMKSDASIKTGENGRYENCFNERLSIRISN